MDFHLPCPLSRSRLYKVLAPIFYPVGAPTPALYNSHTLTPPSGSVPCEVMPRFFRPQSYASNLNHILKPPFFQGCRIPESILPVLCAPTKQAAFVRSVCNDGGQRLAGFTPTVTERCFETVSECPQTSRVCIGGLYWWNVLLLRVWKRRV